MKKATYEEVSDLMPRCFIKAIRKILSDGINTQTASLRSFHQVKFADGKIRLKARYVIDGRRNILKRYYVRNT